MEILNDLKFPVELSDNNHVDIICCAYQKFRSHIFVKSRNLVSGKDHKQGKKVEDVEIPQLFSFFTFNNFYHKNII